MINALRAEVLRLVSRRIIAVALLGLLALIGLYQLQVNSEVSPPSAAELAQNQQDYQEYQRDWEANHEEWEADCKDSGDSDADCAYPAPDPTDWDMTATPFDEAAQPAVQFSVYLGGLIVFVALASFIGAETTTGSLANWLTFVPDRSRVMGSKLLVATAFSAVVGVAAGVLTVGAASLLTVLHGQPLTGLAAVSAMAARGALVVTILGICGFTIGLLTGSTGASIGVLLGGVFLTYVQLLLTYSSRWAQHLPPWSPAVNLEAIVEGKATYQVVTGSAPLDSSDGGYVERSISLLHGLGYWAVLLAVLLGVTWALFRRRDVT